MPTKILATADNGNVRVEYDYTLQGSVTTVTAVRCVNNSDQACYCSVTQISNGRIVGQRFPPQTTTTYPVPTGQSQKLEGFIDAQGRLDGIDFQFLWPYP